jgi:hypothetical protein
MERLVPLCRVDQLSQLIEQERRTARGITGRSAETSLCRYRHKEVYGRKKRGVAYNHQGQRVGRPHVAAWAETEIVLAADLGSGTDDPRASAPGLLRRALAGPAGAGAGRGPRRGTRRRRLFRRAGCPRRLRRAHLLRHRR